MLLYLWRFFIDNIVFREGEAQIAVGVQVLQSGDPYRHARITLGGIEPMVSSILASRRLILNCMRHILPCLPCHAATSRAHERRGQSCLELASDFMDRAPNTQQR